MKKPEGEVIRKIIAGERVRRFAYSPNYWQWFAHHKNHNILPDEILGCETQLDLLKWLGVDIFSRNIYSRQDAYWFGGICEMHLDSAEMCITESHAGKDKISDRVYDMPTGKLSETLHYVFNESTLVQKKFLVDDYKKQAALFEKFIGSRRWNFNKEKFKEICDQAGDDAVVAVGDFFSPLKMLHLSMGPVNTVYFLAEEPEFAKRLMDQHELVQLDLVKQAVSNGVSVIMSMDNLDTMFHPPDYVEAYSASFYEKAAKLCHSYDAKFFIHACGSQRHNLSLIDSLNVDGLEGVAFPPLGDVELDEAFKMTSDNFIITGGISAIETRDLKSKTEVFSYVKELLRKLEPFKNRLILSSSCNTPINAPWDTIKYFRDAWFEYSA